MSSNNFSSAGTAPCQYDCASAFCTPAPSKLPVASSMTCRWIRWRSVRIVGDRVDGIDQAGAGGIDRGGRRARNQLGVQPGEVILLEAVEARGVGGCPAEFPVYP